MKTIISNKFVVKSLFGLLVISFVSLQFGAIPSTVYAEDDIPEEVPADVIPPPAPTNISPADNAVDTAVAFGKFDWTDVADNIPNPTNYVLEITLPASLGGGIITIPTTDSEHPIGVDSPPGDYYWRVKAIDEAGNVGPWGETWKLTVSNTPVTPPVDPEATTTDPVATTTDPIATTTPDVDVSICSISPATGRTIFIFPGSKKLVSAPSFGDTAEWGPKVGPYLFSIPQGHYKVTLSAYDAYATRNTVTQPNEQYFVSLKADDVLVATSSALGDLADNIASTSRTEVVNTDLNISTAVTSISAEHAFYPDESSPNSVIPLCASFDFIAGTTTATTTDTGTGTTTATTTVATTTDETGVGGGGGDDPASTGGGSGGGGGGPTGYGGYSTLNGGTGGGAGSPEGQVLGASIAPLAPNTGFGPDAGSTSLGTILASFVLSALIVGFVNRKKFA